MRLNVVPAASALLAASLTLFSAAPALAGDAAQFDPIGFSEDGRYFAYEEYGIQDGSGFPYATIYLVDLIAQRATQPLHQHPISGQQAVGVMQMQRQPVVGAQPEKINPACHQHRVGRSLKLTDIVKPADGGGVRMLGFIELPQPVLTAARAGLQDFGPAGEPGLRGKRGLAKLFDRLETWKTQRCREPAQARRRQFGAARAFTHGMQRYLAWMRFDPTRGTQQFRTQSVKRQLGKQSGSHDETFVSIFHHHNTNVSLTNRDRPSVS